jgi:hypothetical protein
MRRKLIVGPVLTFEPETKAFTNSKGERITADEIDGRWSIPVRRLVVFWGFEAAVGSAFNRLHPEMVFRIPSVDRRVGLVVRLPLENLPALEEFISNRNEARFDKCKMEVAVNPLPFTPPPCGPGRTHGLWPTKKAWALYGMSPPISPVHRAK